MANAALADKYGRYKTGTKQLVNWLANTARRHRDVTDLLPTLRTSRNAIKQTKAKRKKAQAHQEEVKVVVTTRSLLQLAEVVAGSSVAIPQYILIIARDVIDGRQACAHFQ